MNNELEQKTGRFTKRHAFGYVSNEAKKYARLNIKKELLQKAVSSISDGRQYSIQVGGINVERIQYHTLHTTRITKSLTMLLVHPNDAEIGEYIVYNIDNDGYKNGWGVPFEVGRRFNFSDIILCIVDHWGEQVLQRVE